MATSSAFINHLTHQALTILGPVDEYAVAAIPGVIRSDERAQLAVIGQAVALRDFIGAGAAEIPSWSAARDHVGDLLLGRHRQVRA